MKSPKKQLFYKTWTETSHGYTSTHVYIFSGRAAAIGDKIAGCVDNAAGYGSDEAAATLLTEFSALRRDGVTHVVDGDYSWGERLTVRCQHSRRNEDGAVDYCDPHFEVGESCADIERNLGLLKRIARKADVRADNLTPEAAIKAVEAMGAKRVEDGPRFHKVIRPANPERAMEVAS